MKIPQLKVEPQFGGFGEAMMSKMGWSKGDGLGKDRQGMNSCIEVKKKDDQIGVGGNEGYDWGQKWWENVYDDRLQSKLDKLAALGGDSDDNKGKKNRDKKKKSKKKVTATNKDDDSSSSSSDSDSDADSDVSEGRDGIMCTATSSERAIAKALMKDDWGRWGGKKGKFGRLKEAEESFLQSQAPATPEAKASTNTLITDQAKDEKDAKEKRRAKRKKAPPRAEEVEFPRKKIVCLPAQLLLQKKDGDGEGDAEREKPKKSKQKKKREAVPAVEAAEALEASAGDEPGSVWSAAAAAPASAEPRAARPAWMTEDWWGRHMFTYAGLLGNLHDDDALSTKKRKPGFNEDDQEDIYTRAQSGKTSGKQGLGKRTQNKLGMDFRGSAVKFDEEETDKAAAKAAAAFAQKANDQAPGKALKWKKTILRVLAEGGGRVKQKKLQKRVLAALQDHAPAALDLEAAFLKQISKGTFITKDGFVSVAESETCGTGEDEPGSEQNEEPRKKKKKSKK